MIYCFDLDGTLCSVAEDYRKAKPFKDRIKAINQLHKNGHIIYIDSARGTMTNKDWELFTKKQLKKWGVRYHLLRTGVKLFAHHYIDDNGQNADEYFLC